MSSSLNLTINIPNNDIHSMDNNGSGAIQHHEKVKKKSALKKKKSASKKKKTSSSSLSVSTNTTSNHQGSNHEFLFKPCEVHFRPYSEQLQQQSTITTSDEKNNETISTTTTTTTTMTSNDENGITPSETSAQQQLESIHKSNNNHHHHHHHSTIVSSLTLSLMKNTTTTTTTTTSSSSPHAEHSNNNKKKNLVKSLTHDLVSQYKQCSSEFKYTSPKRILTQPSDPASNNGLDNVDGNLILAVDDVLGERYVVKDVLGMGTFGQVARCEDTQNIGSPHLAVKVIKNKRAYLKQAEVETQILRLLCQNYDPDNTHHIIRMDHYFFHQNHLCIVFEMLSINLFELIKQNRFRGLSTNVIRVFLSQMLDALCVLQKAKIIHCDLKPENILLTDLSSPKNLIKLIDFGSACFEKETVYSYIQSRFYRSPDVLFGVEYNCAIDMWSLGCICAELFLGLPLFPGASQYNQVARIVEMLGMPPAYLLDTGRTSRKYFKRKPYMMNPSDHPYEMKTEQEYCLENNDTPKEWKRYFNYTKLDDLIKYYSYKNIPQEEVKNEELNRVALIDLLHGLLHWDPNLRWTANQAKNHPFVTGEPFTGPFVPEMDAERTMIPIKTQHAVPYATAPPVATSWGNSYHNQPMPQQQQQQPLGKRVMSGGLSQQFVTPNSWGPQTGFLGSNVSLGNLGPSPNPMFGSYSQAQPVVQQQQQQGAQQEKQGIPIGRGNQQQQSWNQQSYGNNSYGYGSSPMYTSPMSSSGSYMGSSLNMPMVQGTPTNNYNNSYSSNSGGHWQGSLPNSFNGGNHMAFSPQQQPQQQQQQKWSQKKSSYRGTLSEQFNSMQLDNSPNVRQRSSSSATASSYNNSPRQQQQHQQQQQQQLQQYENHKGRARRESYAGQPRSHKSQKRRPSIQEQEPAMLSASLLNDPDYSSNAANEPSSPPFDSEMSSSSDNWNPFFPGEDLELDDAPPPPTSSSSTHHNNNNSSNNWSNSSYGNSQKNNNYNNNNNTNNSYQSHQGRNRSSSFNNKKGQHNNEKAYRNNNGASGSSVGSFKQYHGNGSFVSSSSYDGNSYDPSMMYGSSPAMNMTGLGSSPSSYSNMNNPNNNNNSISGSGSYSHQAGGSWRNHNSNLNSFNNNNPPKKQQSQKR